MDCTHRFISEREKAAGQGRASLFSVVEEAFYHTTVFLPRNPRYPERMDVEVSNQTFIVHS